MSTTSGQPGERSSADLAEELHELEVQEAALERRTRALELGGPVTVLFSVLALALSIGALVVALTSDSGGNGVIRMPAAAGGPG